MQFLQPPSIILEPHQPDAGATQQQLPTASSSQPTITEFPPRPQRPTEPRAKARPRPTPNTSQPQPQPNFQERGHHVQAKMRHLRNHHNKISTFMS